jgi:hypothetical protein
VIHAGSFSFRGRGGEGSEGGDDPGFAFGLHLVALFDAEAKVDDLLAEAVFDPVRAGEPFGDAGLDVVLSQPGAEAVEQRLGQPPAGVMAGRSARRYSVPKAA